MSAQRRTSPLLVWLLIALCVVPGLSVAANFAWLKAQPDDVVFLVSGIAAAVTIGACLMLAIVQDRHMDEWQRTNSRFSGYWGDAAGTSLVAVLIAVPAFRDWVVSTVGGWADVPNPDAQLVILTFVFGFMMLVITKMVFTVLLSLGWTWWKSRAPRAAS